MHGSILPLDTTDRGERGFVAYVHASRLTEAFRKTKAVPHHRRE
jgi:hypothetical protein